MTGIALNSFYIALAKFQLQGCTAVSKTVENDWVQIILLDNYFQLLADPVRFNGPSAVIGNHQIMDVGASITDS